MSVNVAARRVFGCCGDEGVTQSRRSCLSPNTNACSKAFSHFLPFINIANTKSSIMASQQSNANANALAVATTTPPATQNSDAQALVVATTSPPAPVAPQSREQMEEELLLKIQRSCARTQARQREMAERFREWGLDKVKEEVMPAESKHHAIEDAVQPAQVGGGETASITEQPPSLGQR